MSPGHLELPEISCPPGILIKPSLPCSPCQSCSPLSILSSYWLRDHVERAMTGRKKNYCYNLISLALAFVNNIFKVSQLTISVTPPNVSILGRSWPRQNAKSGHDAASSHERAAKPSLMTRSGQTTWASPHTLPGHPQDWLKRASACGPTGTAPVSRALSPH
jgi:hypothetical protein